MIFAYELYGLYTFFPIQLKMLLSQIMSFSVFMNLNKGELIYSKLGRNCVEKLKTLSPIISFSHVLNHEIFVGNSYFNARISQIIKRTPELLLCLIFAKIKFFILRDTKKLT